MVFDLDVPTIGAIPGPGFHWDSAMLSDITIASEDTWMEVPHAHGGLVPGDGMGLMMQHYLGTKRGTYYMMTSRQITAQQMLDAGMVSEVVAKGKETAWAWSAPGRSPVCGSGCPMRTAASCPTWLSAR